MVEPKEALTEGGRVAPARRQEGSTDRPKTHIANLNPPCARSLVLALWPTAPPLACCIDKLASALPPIAHGALAASCLVRSCPPLLFPPGVLRAARHPTRLQASPAPCPALGALPPAPPSRNISRTLHARAPALPVDIPSHRTVTPCLHVAPLPPLRPRRDAPPAIFFFGPLGARCTFAALTAPSSGRTEPGAGLQVGQFLGEGRRRGGGVVAPGARRVPATARARGVRASERTGAGMGGHGRMEALCVGATLHMRLGEVVAEG